MNSFFTELKSAREAKGISLAQISDATLITLKMLEAMERGDVHVVPQAYVRAFLREYAAVVGLDPDDTMKKYDASLRQKETATEARRAEDRKTEDVTKEKQEAHHDKFRRLMPAFIKIAAAIVVLVLVDIALWSVLDKEPTQAIKETPFYDTVRENKVRAGMKNDVNPPDAITQHNNTSTSASASSTTDSLTLIATTTDSVWMEIVIDDEVLTEHLFTPKSTYRWRAKREFWISAIGNPYGIRFTLNGKPMTIPIRAGFVTRDVRLTRDSL
jgi:cytoskeletal protein RodZ